MGLDSRCYTSCNGGKVGGMAAALYNG